MQKILIACLILMSVGTAQAQLEMSVQSSYELPIDELKWVYKPGLNNTLFISKIKTYKNKRTAFGGNLGFSSFQPKAEKFYYLVNEDEVGTITYGNYQALQLAVHGRRDFILNKSVELFVGLEVGIAYTKFTYVSDDPYISEDATTIHGRVLLTPRAGVNFIISNSISIFLCGRYAVSFASTDVPEDILNFSVAGAAGLNFRF